MAEELHFGRAAHRLGMTQPPLSQSIRRLEDSLECQLFLRVGRRVELTAAGETLLGHARDIVNQLEIAERAVRRANEVGVTRLAIGFTPNSLSDCLPTAIRSIKAIAPNVELQLREAQSSDQIQRLMTGELDLGFFVPQSLKLAGLDVRVVEQGTLLAAIPADWPLAERQEIALGDLSGQPMLLFPATKRPDLHATILAALRRTGGAPNITQEAEYDFTRLKLVAAGLGVSVINEMAAPGGYPGVALRRISDLPDSATFEIAMAWRLSASPGVRRIFVAAYDAVRAHQDSRPSDGARGGPRRTQDQGIEG